MAARLRNKSAIAGLRSMQALGAVAVPLDNVPEETEAKPENPKTEIFVSDDWKSVEHAVNNIFRGDFLMSEEQNLFKLHQTVKNILRSRTGTFLCDCYKDWIAKELNIKAQQFWNLHGTETLKLLENVWIHFYKDILPMLEAVFYLLKPLGRQSIRTSTLLTFRDVVLFSESVENVIIAEPTKFLSPEIKSMILILYSVNDSYPPSKNKLGLESLAANFCDSFMGYFGLYRNEELVTPSNEPATVAKRSADLCPRRISRPFSVQPQQMETLSQLFKNAAKHHRPRGESHRSHYQKNIFSVIEKL